MHYETVQNIDELNFKINNYINQGYKLEFKDDNQATLVKNKFSWGIFVLLLFLLIIGAVIYLAIRHGAKDVIIIKIGEINTKNQFNHIKINNICQECGYENDQGSFYCLSCGNKLIQKTHVDDNNKENTNVSILCPICGNKNEKNSDFCSDCGEKLN